MPFIKKAVEKSVTEVESMAVKKLAKPRKGKGPVPVLEAWPHSLSLRRYVNRDGKFRTGLSDDDKVKAERLVKRLNVVM